MPMQILVPVHTYPDGNSPHFAKHVAAAAQHLDGAAHGLVLNPLMIMGGFGHSRMRGFVLGGATSCILRNLKLPALLSH